MTHLKSRCAEALSGVADGVGSALGVAAEVLPLGLSRRGARGAPLEGVADESEPALDIIMMNYLLKFSNMGFGCTVVEQLIYVCHRFSSTKSGLLSLDIKVYHNMSTSLNTSNHQSLLLLCHVYVFRKLTLPSANRVHTNLHWQSYPPRVLIHCAFGPQTGFRHSSTSWHSE